MISKVICIKKPCNFHKISQFVKTAETRHVNSPAKWGKLQAFLTNLLYSNHKRVMKVMETHHCTNNTHHLQNVVMIKNLSWKKSGPKPVDRWIKEHSSYRLLPILFFILLSYYDRMLYWKLRRATQRSNQLISSKQTQAFVWENHRFIHQVKMMTQHGTQHRTQPHSFVSMIYQVLVLIRSLSPSGGTHWQQMTQNHSRENPRGNNYSKSTLLMMPYSNKWCYSLLLMIGVFMLWQLQEERQLRSSRYIFQSVKLSNEVDNTEYYTTKVLSTKTLSNFLLNKKSLFSISASCPIVGYQ